MGTWGSEPWENDAAADWYGELLASTRLAERVEATLRDDGAAPEERRGAASVPEALGRVYVWPVGSLDALTSGSRSGVWKRRRARATAGSARRTRWTGGRRSKRR